MAITYPATTLADGALFSKTWVDMVIDDINHLSARPDGFDFQLGTGQTATSATYVQMSAPTVVLTPLKSGNVFVIASLTLASSAGGDLATARIDMNGSKSGAYSLKLLVTSQEQQLIIPYVMSVTANTAYTFKFEFNRALGSGTVVAVTSAANFIYVLEVG